MDVSLPSPSWVWLPSNFYLLDNGMYLHSFLFSGIERLPIWDFPGKKMPKARKTDVAGLFILCMEFFSQLIKKNTSYSNFNFHPKCKKLKITHLLFADDLMFFSRGDLPSIYILMECLQEFRDIFSLAVNTFKLDIFTTGIQNDVLDGNLTRMESARSDVPVQYLGISLVGGFRSLITYRLWTRLQVALANGRLSPFLSQADWNLYIQLFRVWSVSGSKYSHFQLDVVLCSANENIFESTAPNPEDLVISIKLQCIGSF
ncbi:UNVERIFIED_CONTAM: hypothetical protein Sangu_2905000 [Sesamum angustifolium]|uniref:Reverse transcriptase domain-containing protein n=1 Tax=Sesamum angustifolium TaxID=2727405 RepID=A0AAW2INH7_9LAMI